MASEEEVILQIEDHQVKYLKRTLVDKSDYFKVMFDGNFIERGQNLIKLKDVDFNSLNLILTLLADDATIINEEDLLPVLQAACMLQFEEIRSICVERLTEILSVQNCLKIWQVCTSLDLKPLYLKAKNLSLIEFDVIKHTDCLLELSIAQLHAYLANVLLRVDNELDVFTTCMRWWYENSTKEEFTMNTIDESKLFYYFLTFLDFNTLSDNEIKEILIYPDIATNQDIVNILNNVLKIRNCSNFDENKDLSKENVLLNCKRRVKNVHPCLLINVRRACYDAKHSDEFLTLTKKNHDFKNKNVLLLDTTKSNFKKLLTVPPEKHKDLQGFHILGYKELIFVFGGEICLGQGNWSSNFWVFDTVRERWERKTIMPFERRHFESCIANDIVYIVGGTGNFRVLQDTMFWYNYKLNLWSKQIPLPCTGRQVKCCEYKRQLLLLNVNNKCGYLFNILTNNWIELKICDKNGLVSTFPEQYLVFSYEDFVYIKGSSIIKLAIIDTKLEVLSTRFLKPINYEIIDTHMCSSFVYTIYKNVSVTGNSVFTFEKFNISKCTDELVIDIFHNDYDESDIELCGEVCRFNGATKLFSLSHYSMVEDDTYLTDVLL